MPILSPATIYKILGGTIVGILALIGAFFFGLHLGKLESKVTIADLNIKAANQKADYEKKLGDAKNTIVTQYVDKWHTIKETQYVNVESAKSRVPSQFELSNGWVSTHDSAAGATKVDPTAAADATASGIRDNQTLITIVNNYAKYHSCQAQLNAVLDLIDKHNQTIDEINSRKGKK